jgi:hypothetical protein
MAYTFSKKNEIHQFNCLINVTFYCSFCNVLVDKYNKTQGRQIANFTLLK